MRSEHNVVLRGSTRSFSEEFWQTEDRLVYLMLNFPYRCGYNCLKCCNLVYDVRPVATQRKSILPILECVGHRAARQDFKVLVIAGEGEPLTDPDFRQVVRDAVKLGLIPYVFTNGSLLAPDMVDFLASQGASLIIGLDSLDPDLYGRLTGGGRLNDVLLRLDYCRRVYGGLIGERGSLRLVSLAVNMVVTSLNVQEVDSIRRFCDQDMVFVCNRPTKVGMAEHNWHLLYGDIPTNPEVERQVDRMASECGPLGSTPDGEWCAYMKHGISLGSDGSVLTCAYSLETAGFYGRLRAEQDPDLASTNQVVMQSVQEFYRMHGHNRCIVRHPKYKSFLAFLRDRQLKTVEAGGEVFSWQSR